MPIKGRVGRHAKTGGRQCQNWPADQQTVIELLNRIPAAEGGTGGTLAGRLVSGIASHALCNAILVFEERHFPGQRSGFVDPDGPMLRRMQEIVARSSGQAAQPAPVSAPSMSKLALLAQNLLDDAKATKLDPFWAMHKVQFKGLTQMAHKHIDNLIEMNLEQLPWKAELFGRAFVLTEGELLYHFPTFVSTAKSIFVGRDDPLFLANSKTGEKVEGPKLPEMSYGKPVDISRRIFTARMPAILLYQSGGVARLLPYQWGFIQYLDPEVRTDAAPSYWES